MPADIIRFPDRPSREQLDALRQLVESLPLSFRNEHCEAARVMLGWSIEALAFRSKVSPAAIARIEKGEALREVTMQALAFAFEREGLIFFPGNAPFTGANCRGATKDPRNRSDYHLIE